MRNYRKELFFFKQSCCSLHNPDLFIPNADYSIIFDEAISSFNIKKNIIQPFTSSYNSSDKNIANYWKEYLYSLSICLDKISSRYPSWVLLNNLSSKPVKECVSPIINTIFISPSLKTNINSFRLAASSLNKGFIKNTRYLSNKKDSRSSHPSEPLKTELIFTNEYNHSATLSCDTLFFNISFILLHNIPTSPYSFYLSPKDVPRSLNYSELISRFEELNLVDIMCLIKENPDTFLPIINAYSPDIFKALRNPVHGNTQISKKTSIRKFYMSTYKDINRYYLSLTDDMSITECQERIFDYFFLETILGGSCLIQFLNTFSEHRGSYITKNLGVNNLISIYKKLCSIRNFFVKSHLINIMLDSYSNEYTFRNKIYPAGKINPSAWINNLQSSFVYIANTYEPQLIKSFFSLLYANNVPAFSADELDNIFNTYTNMLNEINMDKDFKLKEMHTNTYIELLENLSLAYADFARKN